MEEDQDRCTCKEKEYDDHPCPYSQEIANDDEFTCNCCEYCEYQCCMDI